MGIFLPRLDGGHSKEATLESDSLATFSVLGSMNKRIDPRLQKK